MRMRNNQTLRELLSPSIVVANALRVARVGALSLAVSDAGLCYITQTIMRPTFRLITQLANV